MNKNIHLTVFCIMIHHTLDIGKFTFNPGFLYFKGGGNAFLSFDMLIHKRQKQSLGYIHKQKNDNCKNEENKPDFESEAIQRFSGFFIKLQTYTPFHEV